MGNLKKCPLEKVMNILSKKWTLLIVATIGNHGQLRFSELMRELSGISPKSLTERLKELEAAGLIERKVVTDRPPKTLYSLTKDGIELRDIIRPLVKWALSREREKEAYAHSPCVK